MMSGLTFSWSYSALNTFEICPKRHYHYNIAKDIPYDKENQFAGEGLDLHRAFNDRIVKATPLPLGMGQFEGLLSKVLGTGGSVHSEVKLAITSAFTPTAWRGSSAWLRTVVDCTVVQGATAALFDWKSGKPRSDITQLQIMSAAMLHHVGELQRVRAALVYLNYDQVEREEYTRADLPDIWNELLPRVRKLERAIMDQEFPAKVNGLCRRYCAVVSCPHHGGGA